MGAVGLAVVVALVWIARPLPAPRVLQTTQLTRDSTPKTNALTDGSRIYIQEQIGQRQILVQASASGGETSPISVPFSNFFMSDIAPDNSGLLIVSSPDISVKDPDAFLLPLPSGTPRRLGNITPRIPVWFPDGKRIAFATLKGRDLWVADGDGSNPKKLVSLPAMPLFIRVSRDGTRLRFFVDGKLWEVSSDGTNLHQLLSGWHVSEQMCCGVWTPDGRNYLFVSMKGTDAQIYVLPEPRWPFHRHPSPEQLTSGPMLFTWGVPTPDGTKFLADGYIQRSELVRYDDHAKGFVPFLSGISADYVDFSRDGKWVVYVSIPDQTLWRSRADGSERLQLTSPPIVPFLPHWSPDGTQIIFSDVQSEQWKAMLVSAQGGNASEMYPENHSQVDVHFSPDGKRIVFGRFPFAIDKPDVFDIRIFDVDAKQITVVPGSQSYFAPRWSPDGKYLAAISIDNKKFVVYDFKTQKWSDWVTEFAAVGTPVWSRDSEYLYFDVSAAAEHPGYYRVRLGQSHPEFIADLKDLHRSWWSGITPDNIPIFSRDVSTDEIYALDVELP